jgi:hypothetical protein
MIFPCRALFRNGSRVRRRWLERAAPRTPPIDLAAAGPAPWDAARSGAPVQAPLLLLLSLSRALSSAGAITITMHRLIAPTANLFRWCADTDI